MKILFLTLRADFGGGPEHLWQLLQRVPQSVGAYVACPNDYPYYERYLKIIDYSHVVALPHRRLCLRSLWALWRFCRKHNISVLHAHGKGAGFYARCLAILTNLPCVYTFHGVHMDSYSPLKRCVYQAYERIMALFTQSGIAVSKGEMELIIAERLMPAPKLRLIPNGVNAAGNLVNTSFPLSPPYVIVTLSRFDYQKNSMFVLDIAKELDSKGRRGEFQVVIVGEGEDRQAMMDSAQANGQRSKIFFPGASPHASSFFEGALCYLSTSRWEGMPLAVLEAMGHGLAVVASDVVGNRDAVSHGETGFLYPEGNASAAAEALCRLADDPELRRTMGDRAREYILRYHSVEAMAAKTFEVLKEASR